MNASTVPSMRLDERAPAPVAAPPSPIAAATATAIEDVLMLEVSSASRTMPPLRDFTFVLAFEIDASTPLWISLSASATPIDTASAAIPNDTATATAATV